MATVKLILRTDKTDATGEAPLFMRIIKDRKALKAFVESSPFFSFLAPAINLQVGGNLFSLDRFAALITGERATQISA